MAPICPTSRLAEVHVAPCGWPTGDTCKSLTQAHTLPGGRGAPPPFLHSLFPDFFFCLTQYVSMSVREKREKKGFESVDSSCSAIRNLPRNYPTKAVNLWLPGGGEQFASPPSPAEAGRAGMGFIHPQAERLADGCSYTPHTCWYGPTENDSYHQGHFYRYFSQLEPLVATRVGTLRSLVTHTNKCRWTIMRAAPTTHYYLECDGRCTPPSR